MAGGIFIIGYVAFTALYAYLHMRITNETDPVMAAITAPLWPLCLPFLLVLAAAKLGARR